MSGSYHHGDLREALIEAGTQALEEGAGPPGLRDVARRVGVSPTATYRHFASRDALLHAIAGRGFSDLGGRFFEAMAGYDPGREGPVAPNPLVALGKIYVAFARERPAMFRLMFGGILPISTSGDDRIGSGAFQALLKAVSTARRMEIDNPVVLVAAVRAWSLVHGYAMLLLDDRLPDVAQGNAFLTALLAANDAD